MKHFWETKALDEMSPQEWESLCDGCAKCCLHKLQDEDSGQLHYTRIRCRYLDEERCQCTDYENRSVRVPDCIELLPQNVADLDWLPSTCAYRLLARGESLPEWHYLVCGDRHEVHRVGASIRGKVISEEFVHPDGYDEHIIHWVE